MPLLFGLTCCAIADCRGVFFIKISAEFEKPTGRPCGMGREMHRSFCRVNSRSQLLDLVGVLARRRTSVDRRRCARSPEEEVRVDPGLATTRSEYTQVVNGGGSGGGGLRRLDNHAQGEIGGLERHPSMLGQIGGSSRLQRTTSPGPDRDLAKVRTLRPRRLTRRPSDTRRTVTSQRLGPGSRHARSRKESALESCCRGDDQRQGRAPCRRRRHSAKVLR